ncbi:MAG TPA: c-type cytochrome domain-containing protein [Pirellulales bacterium]|nr:c-type cytochrome domain-containing protein [Pirellulales bacterium]
MRRNRFALWLVNLSLVAFAGPMAGRATADDKVIPIAEIKRDTPVDFQKEVLPLLKRNCVACHNATKAESGLVLETPQSIIKGGDSGPAALPMKAAESLLLGRATGNVDSLMPPSGNKVAAKALTPEELGLIKLWIDQGAGGIVTGQADEIKWQPLPPGVNPIYAAAVTPDGQYVACGRANQIFVYHLPSGRFVCRLTDPELLKSGVYSKPGVADLDLIQSLAFSHDGTLLASGGYRDIKIWKRPRDLRLATLDTASADGVQTIAVSPDGKWLATAAADNSIKLWDLATGQPARAITGHAGVVTALRFSADGTKLFSGSADKTIRSWQVADGAPVGRIDTPQPVQSLALVGAGERLASGGGDNTIRIWTTPAGATRSVAGLTGAATALALSPDKKILAVATAEGPIQVFDLASGQAVKTLAGHAGPVTGLRFQSNGARLASGGADKTLRVWDVASGQPVARIEGFSAVAVESVALHPGGNQAATGAADGQIATWKLDVPAPRALGGADEAPATVAAVSRDGRWLATAGLVGGKPTILVRDVASGAVAKTLVGHEAQVTALAFSPDGNRVISGSQDKTARVWNLADGQQIAKFAGHTQTVSAVAFDAGGGQAVSGSTDNSLKLWNTADGSELKNFAGHGGPIVGVAMTGNNQRVVSASADQTVRLWNPADGQQAGAFGVGVVPTALALSRDDNRVVVGCTDNSVKLFQVADGKLLANLTGHAVAVGSVGFSADGTRVVSAAAGERAIVWDTTRAAALESLVIGEGGVTFAQFTANPNEIILGSGNKLIHAATLHFERVIPGHMGKISGLAYSNDGGLIFSASADGTLRGFQTGDGAQRYAAQAGGPLHALAVSPDGNWLATAGEDKSVRVFNAGNGSPGPKPQFVGFTAPVKAVAFSADGQLVIGGGNESIAFNLMTGEAVQSFAEQTGLVGLASAGDKAEFVVGASSDKSIRVWPLLLVRQIAGHGQPVTALATVPGNNQQILSGSQDGTVRLWNVDNGQQMQQLNYGAAVTSVAVRPDGQRIAAAGASNVVRLWNGQNFQQVAELKGDYRLQFQVAELERGVAARKNEVAAEVAAVTAAENAAKAEDENVKKANDAKAAADKALVEKTEPAKKAMDEKVAADKVVADATAAAKTADEAKANAAKAVTEADAANKAAVEAVAKAQQALNADANNQDLIKAKQAADQAAADAAAKLKAAQEAMAVADKGAADAAAKLKTATDDLAAKTKTANEMEAARKSAETTKLAADKAVDSANVAAKRAADAVPVAKQVQQAADARQKQVEAELEATRKTAAASETPLRSVAFSPDNLELAVGGDDRIVHTFNAETGAAGEVFSPAPGEGGPVLAVAYAAATRIVAASADKKAAVFETMPEWSLARTIGGGPNSPLVDRVTALDFSPDGKLLASGGGDPSRSGELKLWNVADGTLARDLPEAHSDTVLGLDFSPDGRYLASCAADKFIKVFGVADGKFVRSFEGHTHHVLGVRWRADGKVLASCGADNVVKVWDFVTGDQLRTIQGFGKEVTSIHFVGSTSLVLVSSGDKTVRLYNVDNAQQQRAFGGGGDFMYAVATTPDGKFALAGGQDSVLRLWNEENGQELRKFEPPPVETVNPQAAK